MWKSSSSDANLRVCALLFNRNCAVKLSDSPCLWQALACRRVLHLIQRKFAYFLEHLLHISMVGYMGFR